MLTSPLLGRAGELHRQEISGQIGRERQAQRAIAGTRMRGGFFHLSLRQAKPERAQPEPQPQAQPRHPQPAAA